MADEYHRDPILDPPRRKKPKTPLIVGLAFSGIMFGSLLAFIEQYTFSVKPPPPQPEDTIKIAPPPNAPPPPPPPPPPPRPKTEPPPPQTVQPREVKNVVTPPPVVINAKPSPAADDRKNIPPVVSNLPSPPPAPPAPTRPDFITAPDWQSRPDGDALAGLYPPDAADAGINGHTIVTCTVRDNGSVGDCVVKEETPKGRGFGRAAILAAKYFKMRPRTVNGAPVGGAKVDIPLTWRLN
jgi:protein TonB